MTDKEQIITLNVERQYNLLQFEHHGNSLMEGECFGYLRKTA